MCTGQGCSSPFTVIHELIHVQQSYTNKNITLLSHSVFEGAADFLGELACGRRINPHIHECGHKHEAELWNSFADEMHQEDIGNWIYDGWKATGDRPADLGYSLDTKSVNRITRKWTTKTGYSRHPVYQGRT